MIRKALGFVRILAIASLSLAGLASLLLLIAGLIDGGIVTSVGPYPISREEQVDIRFQWIYVYVRGQANFRSDSRGILIPGAGRWRPPIRDAVRVPGLFLFETYDIIYADPKTIAPLPKQPPESGLPTTGWCILIPLPTIAFLLWILPAITLYRGRWLTRLRQHLRRRKGLCIRCGYNLTGNVSGICPECGERI